MRKVNLYILILCALMLAFVVSVQAKSREERLEQRLTWQNYIHVSEWVLDVVADFETVNRDLIGDNGKAIGVYQLWEVYIFEHNRIYGTNYTHEDAKCPYTSRLITKGMLTHMGKYYFKRTGKRPDVITYLRLHNGGYKGYLKASTLENVEKYLNREGNILTQK
jgi:hypothetical protein